MTTEKYNKFIESVQIDQIVLHEMNCKQNNSLSIEKRSNIDIALEQEVKELEFEGIYMNVKNQFNVCAFNSEKYSKQESIEIEHISFEDVLFNIQFVLNLTYSIDIEDVEDVSVELESEIVTFVERNVPINVWPYAREIISDITTRMGFPALVIPPYKNIPVL